MTPEELAHIVEVERLTAFRKSPSEYVQEERGRAVGAVLDWFDAQRNLAPDDKMIEGDLNRACAELCRAVNP